MSVDGTEESKSATTIFAVRTTIGQEKSVLQNMFSRLLVLNPFPDLRAMMIAEQLRGYVFVEAPHKRDVMIAISGLRHVKGKIVGSIQLDNIAHVISPRKVTEILEEGDSVEIVSGIFQGQKAEVVRMPREGAKEEVTLRLMDSDSAISIKIHGDFLKLLEKGVRRQEEYIIDNSGDIDESDIVSGSAPTITEEKDEGMTVSSSLSPDGKDAQQEIFTFSDDMSDEYDVESEDIPDSTDGDKDEDDEEEEEDEWSKFTF